jgi:uncharacterized protein with HEPN domain
MPERLDALWISDIREAIARVEEYTRSMKYSDFLEDKKTQDAVVRNIGIMGEAAKRFLLSSNAVTRTSTGKRSQEPETRSCNRRVLACDID